MKDIAKLLNNLAEEDDIIISNPMTREQLEREGLLQFQKTPERTIEEKLNLLSEKRRLEASDLIKKIPEAPFSLLMFEFL